MSKYLKFAVIAAAGVAVAQPALAQKAAAPAAAPAPTGPVIAGIAVADIDLIVANSAAVRGSGALQQTTYKATLDQAKARRDALNAQLKPLADKFNADRAAANPDQASLEKQLATIRQMENSANQELQQILQPVSLSQTYVQEQVEERLAAAVNAAMSKKKISLLLRPDAVVSAAAPAYNLNQDILTELNALIPTAQIVPPQGWQPRQVREAQAQQAAAQQQNAAPAAGSTSAPSGR